VADVRLDGIRGVRLAFVAGCASHPPLPPGQFAPQIIQRPSRVARGRDLVQPGRGCGELFADLAQRLRI
jgi:hypothetical protein